MLLPLAILSNIAFSIKINGIDTISIREIFGDAPAKYSDKLGAQSSVDISFSSGYANYYISVNGKTWLESGTTAFRNDGKWATLKLSKTMNQTGIDPYGAYNAVVLIYEDTNTSAQFATHFKYYPSEPDLIVFEQTFPDGANNTHDTTQSSNGWISCFPSFKMETVDPSLSLGYAHFGGFMASAGNHKIYAISSSIRFFILLIYNI